MLIELHKTVYQSAYSIFGGSAIWPAVAIGVWRHRTPKMVPSQQGRDRRKTIQHSGQMSDTPYMFAYILSLSAARNCRPGCSLYSISLTNDTLEAQLVTLPFEIYLKEFAVRRQVASRSTCCRRSYEKQNLPELPSGSVLECEATPKSGNNLPAKGRSKNVTTLT